MAGRSAWTPALLVVVVVSGLGAARWPRSSLSAATGTAEAITQLTRRDPASELAAGTLLVASRSLRDPNFAQTVVVIFAHSKGGAAGVVVNRRTPVSLNRVMPDLPIPKGPRPVVFLGGPVETSGVHTLVRGTAESGYPVLKDVYLLRTLDAVDTEVARGTGVDRIRVYLGHAGWGAGQLDREIRLGAWHVFDGRSDLVFDPNPQTLWMRQIRITERPEA